jgi:glycosyltransferase involved in cell wall biosynthesis
VTFEAAFDALKNGDLATAVPVLDAHTRALHHSGENPRLADISFQIGTWILQHDESLAMDYFQRAICAGLDPERVRCIGEVFEDWAQPSPEKPLHLDITHVAHIIGSLTPIDARTTYLRTLISGLKEQGIRSSVFTTESSASWFINTPGVSLSQPLALDAEINIASVDGNFAERALGVAEAIRKSRIQVAFFHSGLEEQITARVASLRVAPVQVSVNHGVGMEADLFDGYIHLSKSTMKRQRFAGRPAEWIPKASDIEERLETIEPVTRQGIGLDSASTVSATFGDLSRVAGNGYLRVLTDVMKRFPQHFHLFAGAGNVRTIRSHLHAEGVLPRVRFLGQVSDVAPLLDLIDLYLASFPKPGEDSILEAMGAGKPVVTIGHTTDSERNSGAELVGIRELTAAGETDYIEITDRLLRNRSLRQKLGQAALERFRAEFRPERLGERYKAFLASFQVP